jgi:RNA polymerase sigma factor (sigma-70 family)
MTGVDATVTLHGDEGDLFRRLQPRLLRAVRREVTASEEVIEDACSFAWSQLLRCQPRRDTVYGWLCKTAIREAWRLSRRERRDVRVEGFTPDGDGEGLQLRAPVELETMIDARCALAALAALPERERRYLTLLVAGHSYVEIRALTQATHTNVNKHLVRARARLRAGERRLAA